MGSMYVLKMESTKYKRVFVSQKGKKPYALTVKVSPKLNFVETVDYKVNLTPVEGFMYKGQECLSRYKSFDLGKAPKNSATDYCGD